MAIPAESASAVFVVVADPVLAHAARAVAPTSETRRDLADR
jgi:hypothetical protein